MDWLIQSLRAHPETTLFLVSALRYDVGAFRLATVSIGPVLGRH